MITQQVHTASQVEIQYVVRLLLRLSNASLHPGTLTLDPCLVSCFISEVKKVPFEGPPWDRRRTPYQQPKRHRSAVFSGTSMTRRGEATLEMDNVAEYITRVDGMWVTLRLPISQILTGCPERHDSRRYG